MASSCPLPATRRGCRWRAVPNGWDSTIVSEESIFFGYPDRGELLGFISDRLIYREAVPAEEVHAIGKMWKRDALFKTRLETGIPP